MTEEHLLKLPTDSLLDKFGAGEPKPGSGSAAALMGILAAKLIITVCKLSLKKPQYRPRAAAINYLVNEIESKIEPRLKELFGLDAESIDSVVKNRELRDKAQNKNEKRKYAELALTELRVATEIPIEICEVCFDLIDQAITVFDIGLKSVRGDSGAAVSAAVAGSMASIFVINLNLRSFRSGEWATDMRRKSAELQGKLEKKQADAFERLAQMKKENLDNLHPDFFLDV